MDDPDLIMLKGLEQSAEWMVDVLDVWGKIPPLVKKGINMADTTESKLDIINAAVKKYGGTSTSGGGGGQPAADAGGVGGGIGGGGQPGTVTLEVQGGIPEISPKLLTRGGKLKKHQVEDALKPFSLVPTAIKDLILPVDGEGYYDMTFHDGDVVTVTAVSATPTATSTPPPPPPGRRVFHAYAQPPSIWQSIGRWLHV